MNHRPESHDRGWARELALRVELVCSRFEDAWKATARSEKRPRIEDFLKGFEDSEYPTALTELVALDAAYRAIHGEQPSATDYHTRFPAHAAPIQLAFDELQTLFPGTAAPPPGVSVSEKITPTAIPPMPMSIPPTRDGWPSTMSLPSGTTGIPPESWPAIPGYEFVSVLGRGGMGVVFQARQLRPSRIVALKMMRDGTLAGPDQLTRFRLEAEIIAKLHHPNIVQIYEVGDLASQPYFSLEFMEGGSLAQRLQGTPQPPRAAAELTETLAGAVDAAHRQGVVHRDLKPSNVLLTAEGLPKITDFGLAKRTAIATEPAGESMPTQTGVVLGTPSYMAPEQARGDQQRIGPATDVYALGAILFELLTGRPPFKAATPVQTVHEVMHEEPVPPKRLQRSIPRDLETICLKCLHKEPERRYESAAALAGDLHRFLVGEPIKARPASAWERAVKWTRRRPAHAALIAVGTAVVVGLLAVTFLFNAWLRKEVRDARAAEQAAVLEKVLEKRKVEIQKLRGEAAALLAANRAQEALTSLDHALDIVGGESALAEFQLEISVQRKEAEMALQHAAAVQKATHDCREFLRRRDEVLFRAAFLLEGGAPAQAVREAAGEALRVLGRTPDDAATLTLGSGYTEEQQAEIRAGCYELLLVLADAVGQAGAGEQPARSALVLLEQAAGLRSPTHAYHLLLARYLERVGRAAEAAKARDQARKQLPTEALDFCLIGQEQLREGDVTSSIKACNKALQKQPYFWAHYLLAVAHIRVKNADAALADLNACLSTPRQSPWPYLARGVVHAQMMNSEEAESDIRKALDLTSDSDPSAKYGVLVTRGAVRVGQHDLVRGIVDLRDAICLQPARAPAYFNLARAYEEAGKAAETKGAVLPSPLLAPVLAAVERLSWLQLAGEQLDKALTHEERVADLYRFRARIHAARGELDAALRAIERAIDLGRPRSAEDLAAKGRILIDLSKYSGALAAFQDASNLPDAGSAVYEGLAKAHLALADGESDAACQRSHYLDAVEALSRRLKAPDAIGGSAGTHRLRGLLRLKLQAFADALGDFNEAMLEPDAELHSARGWAYLALNDLHAAQADFEAALSLNSSEPLALNGRGLVRVQMATTRRELEQGITEAEQAIASGKRNGLRLRDAARVYAQAVRRLAVVVDAPRQFRELYEDKALGLLHRAIHTMEAPQERWAFWQERIQQDPWLEPIRRGPGFRKLEAELFPVSRAAQ